LQAFVDRSQGDKKALAATLHYGIAMQLLDVAGFSWSA
jgi:hypothetical protein